MNFEQLLKTSAVPRKMLQTKFRVVVLALPLCTLRKPSSVRPHPYECAAPRHRWQSMQHCNGSEPCVSGPIDRALSNVRSQISGYLQNSGLHIRRSDSRLPDTHRAVILPVLNYSPFCPKLHAHVPARDEGCILHQPTPMYCISTASQWMTLKMNWICGTIAA